MSGPVDQNELLVSGPVGQNELLVSGPVGQNGSQVRMLYLGGTSSFWKIPEREMQQLSKQQQHACN